MLLASSKVVFVAELNYCPWLFGHAVFLLDFAYCAPWLAVVEAHGKVGTPNLVETWGSPDASRGVLAASFVDHKIDPVCLSIIW